MNNEITLSSFSDHLFWDTRRENIDLSLNKSWLTKRVLEKGTLRDWETLLSLYGKETVRTCVCSLSSLEKKALSYAALILDIDHTSLRCYTNTLSQSTHWNS